MVIIMGGLGDLTGGEWSWGFAPVIGAPGVVLQMFEN